MKIRILLLAITSLFLIHCGSASEDQTFAVPETPSSPPPATGGTSTPTQPVASPSPSSSVSTLRISSFIWKPKSEKNGNLVVLVNPTRVKVLVTGSISESLTDFGPSNGKGTTARSSFSGCSFGDNVTVEFFDSAGKRILTAGGRSSLSIPRGCDRFEF